MIQETISTTKKALQGIPVKDTTFRDLSNAISATNPQDFLKSTETTVAQLDKAQILSRAILERLSSKGKTAPQDMLREAFTAKDILELHNPDKATLTLALSITAQELSNDTIKIPANLTNEEFSKKYKTQILDKNGKPEEITVGIFNRKETSLEIAFSIRMTKGLALRLDQGLPNTNELTKDYPTAIYGLLRAAGLPRIEFFDTFFTIESSLLKPNFKTLPPNAQKSIENFIRNGCKYYVRIDSAKPSLMERVASLIDEDNKPIEKLIIIKPDIDNIDITNAKKNAAAANAIRWLLKEHSKSF